MGKHERNMNNETYEGVVEWFDQKRGFGFIKCDKFTKSIFVHYSRIQSEEKWRVLAGSQKVSFQVVETEKGLMATCVTEHKIIPAKASVV